MCGWHDDEQATDLAIVILWISEMKVEGRVCSPKKKTEDRARPSSFQKASTRKVPLVVS